MNLNNLHDLKVSIHNTCLEMVQTQLDAIQASLDQLMEAKTSETKSSAGDKYETGMAMIQNQEELYRRQQIEAKGRMNQLKSMDPAYKMTAIDKGSLVVSQLGIFYLSIGLGKITVNDEGVFVLSLESPMGNSLKGKKAGDAITFNGSTSRIEKVH